MTDGELDQKEAAQNVNTERWMQQNARRFRMTWMIIPANVCITSKYILRYFLTMAIGITTIYAVLFPLGLLAIFALTARFDAGFRAYLYRIDPYLMKALYILFLRIFGHQFPFFLSFAVMLPLFLSSYLAHCAKYWNRRARRLQANPPMPPAPIHGVWPPPPQIID